MGILNNVKIRSIEERSVDLMIITIAIITGYMLVRDILYVQKYNRKYNELSDSKLRYERIWLIDSNTLPFNLEELEKMEIESDYLAAEPLICASKINNGRFYCLTVENYFSEEGIKKEEYSVNIGEKEYKDLLERKDYAINKVVKTRYEYNKKGNACYIDVYKNALSDYALFVSQFKTLKEANDFSPPDWVNKEVSRDKDFKIFNVIRYGLDHSKTL